MLKFLVVVSDVSLLFCSVCVGKNLDDFCCWVSVCHCANLSLHCYSVNQHSSVKCSDTGTGLFVDVVIRQWSVAARPQWRQMRSSP